MPHTRQVWLSTHAEKVTLSSKSKYESDTFYHLSLFMTRILTYSMYLCPQEDLICFVAIETNFLGKKSVLEEVCKGKIISNSIKI